MPACRASEQWRLLLSPFLADALPVGKNLATSHPSLLLTALPAPTEIVVMLIPPCLSIRVVPFLPKTSQAGPVLQTPLFVSSSGTVLRPQACASNKDL